MTETAGRKEPSESYRLYKELQEAKDDETTIEILKDIVISERAENAKLWGIINTQKTKLNK